MAKTFFHFIEYCKYFNVPLHTYKNFHTNHELHLAVYELIGLRYSGQTFGDYIAEALPLFAALKEEHKFHNLATQFATIPSPVPSVFLFSREQLDELSSQHPQLNAFVLKGHAYASPSQLPYYLQDAGVLAIETILETDMVKLTLCNGQIVHIRGLEYSSWPPEKLITFVRSFLN